MDVPRNFPPSRKSSGLTFSRLSLPTTASQPSVKATSEEAWAQHSLSENAFISTGISGAMVVAYTGRRSARDAGVRSRREVDEVRRAEGDGREDTSESAMAIEAIL